jgi:hypothetical protein
MPTDESEIEAVGAVKSTTPMRERLAKLSVN